MKTLILRLCFCLMPIWMLASCTKDEFSEPKASVGTTLNHPNVEGDYSVKSLQITWKEINSGNEINVSPQPVEATNLTSELPYGTYIATVQGEVEIDDAGQKKTYAIKGYLDNIVITNATAAVTLDLFLSDPSAKFVFKEIFFTGTLTPEQKKYNGDKYFILQNNSTDTLFADGLIIAQSSFLTTTKRVYTPDVMSEAFTTDEIIMLPGSGNEHPVYPGQQLIIANNAIDHTAYNTNSLDLRNADFEIELISTINVDNPAVPNTISLAGNLLMHDRGYTSYVLARLPEGMTSAQFLEQTAYTYSYIGGTGREMFFDAYKIPNEYVMDAVNLSVAESFEWLVTAPTLDMSWTYCGKVSSDANRYGKSVTRKTLSTSNQGLVFLQDTNNSAEDFQAETVPSLK